MVVHVLHLCNLDDDNMSKEEFRRFLLDYMSIPMDKVDKITEDAYNEWTQVKTS